MSEKGDAARGAKIFRRKCAYCHTVEQGAPGKNGPNLFGLFGREAGLDEFHGKNMEKGRETPATGVKTPQKSFADPMDAASPLMSRGLEEPHASHAMKRSNIVWTAPNLFVYLKNPKAMVPGSKMAFRGLPSTADRWDVIAYLQEATAPPPVPE